MDPVEGSKNPFLNAYSAWPFRFFVLIKEPDGAVRVRMKAMPRGASYSLADLRESLLQLNSSRPEPHGVISD